MVKQNIREAPASKQKTQNLIRKSQQTDTSFKTVLLNQELSFFHDLINKCLPKTKTAAPMKTARKIRPGASARYSIKNANNPADRVPNPLLSPLHKVPPAIIINTYEAVVNNNNVNEK